MRDASKQQYLDAWIKACAADDSLGPVKGAHDLLAHLRKHVGPDLERYLTEGKDLKLWSAGMHNLLAVFDAYCGHTVTVDDQLGRLFAKAIGDPKATQPPSFVSVLTGP